MIEGCPRQGLDAHYLGYFRCFNEGRFYEAHDVLEQLWLRDRTHPNCAFYKGLIQLAGAFVHLQKDRLPPAAALFKLARANLQLFPPHHEHLDVAAVLELIRDWLERLDRGAYSVNPLKTEMAPKLGLAVSNVF